MSAASITDNRDNALKRENGAVVARAGAALSLDYLSTYDVKDGDRLDEAGDHLTATRRFQGNPAYRERVYGRVKEDGGRTWLQYWLWCYYNPKHLLGWGKHEGDWEVVQIGLDGEHARRADLLPARDRRGARLGQGRATRATTRSSTSRRSRTPATSSPGRTRTWSASTTPTARSTPVLPTVEEFGSWSRWTGRWGASTRRRAAASSAVAAPPAPAARARSGTTRPPGTVAPRRPRRCARPAARCAQARQGDLPEAHGSNARREGDRVLVDYALDPAPQRRASRLLVTLHRAGEDELVLASCPERVSGARGDGRGAGAGRRPGRPHGPRLGVQRAAPAQRSAADAGRLKGTRPGGRPSGGPPGREEEGDVPGVGRSPLDSPSSAAR